MPKSAPQNTETDEMRSRPHVLVIDGDVDRPTVLADAFDGARYRISRVRNLEEALAVVDDGRVDVVVCGPGPEEDGYRSLLDRIGQIEPIKKRTNRNWVTRRNP